LSQGGGIFLSQMGEYFWSLTVSIMKNIVIQAVACVLILYIMKDFYGSRLLVVYYTSVLFIVVSVQKYCYRKVIEGFRKKGRNTRSMLIVGGGKVGINFYNSITENVSSGYRVVGVLDDKKVTGFGDKYLGSIDRLEYTLSSIFIDEVIICLPNYASERLSYIMDVCRNFVTSVKIIPDFFQFLSEKYEVNMMDRYTIISVKQETINEFHWRLLKRVFDIIFTILAAIFIFSWLWPALMLLQIIFNPGPLYYKGERSGRKGKSFYCYKFR